MSWHSEEPYKSKIYINILFPLQKSFLIIIIQASQEENYPTLKAWVSILVGFPGSVSSVHPTYLWPPMQTLFSKPVYRVFKYAMKSFYIVFTKAHVVETKSYINIRIANVQSGFLHIKVFIVFVYSEPSWIMVVVKIHTFASCYYYSSFLIG